MTNRKELVVALGGGGVKGAAHVGVLRALLQEGYQIKAVAGSSAGAMIGSFYAAGFSLDEIQARLNNLDQVHLFQRKQGEGPAFMGLSGSAALISGFLKDLTFADLPTPFAVTVTNLETGQPEVISSGSVCQAVLASIAVPGVFPPQRIDGKILIDGGVLNPVPVKLARDLSRGLGASLPVVAVALSPVLSDWGRIPNKRGLFATIPLIGSLAEKMVWAQALEIFTRAVDLGGLIVTDLRIELEKPEVLVRPEIHDIGLIDKIDVDKLVMAGELALLKHLPELQQVTTQPLWAQAMTTALARLIGKHYPALQDEVIRQKYG